jgi:hypothetical protein
MGKCERKLFRLEAKKNKEKPSHAMVHSLFLFFVQNGENVSETVMLRTEKSFKWNRLFSFSFKAGKMWAKQFHLEQKNLKRNPGTL